MTNKQTKLPLIVGSKLKYNPNEHIKEKSEPRDFFYKGAHDGGASYQH